ncbi:hypothetical protein DFR29_11834 [Tahibacter aquaticus]|uniref:Sel1 repeat family protein n=1 Tax=Tahibacter aquaticus TaxID=520092 RepID=A0A4R6YN44_9GAMM|nr:hypothetical protein [Tahibacter aquaticus]TDR38891.1 hypothetical protein DFR29_11834 [Tahibacter aquaticus]
MRRLILICLVLAVLATSTYFLVSSRKDNIRGVEQGTLSSMAPPSASAQGGRLGASPHHLPNTPAIVDEKLPPNAYRPPVFQAIPEGLNGRQLREIHDSLVKAAESGDAAVAYKLAALMNECTTGLRQAEEIKQKNVTTILPADPVANIWLKEKFSVISVQCPQLTKGELDAAGHWMLLAAKGGDRQALLSLTAFPPETQDPDYEAKKIAWQETLTTGLDALAQARDTEAAIELARYFFKQRGLANLKVAYKYFDIASKGNGSASKIEFAVKMRDQTAAEIAREERGG